MKHNICMVCDFFYPNMGGVESHIFQLSQCLLLNSNKVIVITHAYGDRSGVRYMTNHLKVYYLPLRPFYNQCILPTVFSTLPLIRDILIRENITIVHGHSAFSTLAHETMFHACLMGLKTVFTEHSLFGFADASSIITNQVLMASLVNVSHTICVSHTSKENIVLRTEVHPNLVSVIPNAIDPYVFTPDPSMKRTNCISIVIISRLVYRKGIELLIGIIPEICKLYSDVNFIIGGDGPQRILIEEIKERYHLHDRIELLGALPHSQVRDVLVQGDIFLNTSLTEAFCIAIIEAASCGLQVISTKVGGIPEVLPPEYIRLAEPSVKALMKELNEAILDRRHNQFIPETELHQVVSSLYTWQNVAIRTENIYDKIFMENDTDLKMKITKFLKIGPIWGKILIFVTVLNYVLLLFVEWLRPSANIDKAFSVHERYKIKKQSTF